MASSLHVVMLPWLAMGHLLPYLEFSKRLVRRGHRISLLTTPSNIRRLLPAVPPHLSPLIHLVELRMPRLSDLPENTTDLDSDHQRPHLAEAYDSFEPQLDDFLQQQHHQSPDWILYDYSAEAWAPRVAAEHGVASSYLCLFNAAVLAFHGGVKYSARRSAPEEFTTVPDWIPFPNTVAYRLHEARRFFKPAATVDYAPDYCVSSKLIDTSTSLFIFIRSCYELEGEWLELLPGLFDRPVVPVGLFPPPAAEAREDSDGDGDGDGDGDSRVSSVRSMEGIRLPNIIEWLDKQEPRSVVYAAFGSEAKLTSEQAAEIAMGLELSGAPFLWAARAAQALPEGFESRMEGRGVVWRGWVPQVKLLAHPAVGGFLTHGGWNSLVEGMSAGAAMVVLPLMFEQGLNARHMVDMGMAVEVPRDEEGDKFTGQAIAGCLRMAMVEKQGEGLRKKAMECREVFGDEELQDRYMDRLVEMLWEHKKM